MVLLICKDLHIFRTVAFDGFLWSIDDFDVSFGLMQSFSRSSKKHLATVRQHRTTRHHSGSVLSEKSWDEIWSEFNFQYNSPRSNPSNTHEKAPWETQPVDWVKLCESLGWREKGQRCARWKLRNWGFLFFFWLWTLLTWEVVYEISLLSCWWNMDMYSKTM